MSQDDSGASIRALRATRAYTSEALDKDDLNAILEAGRWTGSSLNSQPWTFVVATSRDSKQKLSQAGNYATHLASAAVVVVLVCLGGDGDGPWRKGTGLG